MFKRVIKDSIPVMSGYIVLGMGFGILLQSKGYGWPWALAMSLFIYAGSMQFVTINLLTAGASLISAALMTLMVNLRHLFYAITMLDKYKALKTGKLYSIFALTDETFSLVCSVDISDDAERNKYYLMISAVNQFYWVFGSLIGSLLGNILPFNTDGIDFAMTALFFVIVINQWEEIKDHSPALTGFAVSIICLLIFGPDSFLIPSMILITAALFAIKAVYEKKAKLKGGEANE